MIACIGREGRGDTATSIHILTVGSKGIPLDYLPVEGLYSPGSL